MMSSTSGMYVEQKTYKDVLGCFYKAHTSIIFEITDNDNMQDEIVSSWILGS